MATTASRGTARAARRAPFATNPVVGSRGLRTHQRILDAALAAFGEAGYDRTTLDRIADLAGCSRVTIYQYASGKDELFRRLGAQAATQMWAAMESLDDVTPDVAGHAALRAFVSRLADVEVRYEPILRAFDAASGSDETLALEADAIVRRGIGVLEARVVGTDLPPRLLDPTVELLNTGLVSALSRMSILRAAAPEAYSRERVDRALADVLHRVLFGVLPGVNDQAPAAAAADPPTLVLDAEAVAAFRRADALAADAANPSKRALRSMLAVANGLIAERGYQGLRIDDIVRAAGVSRGSFYTYFDDIEDFVRVVGIRAIQEVAVVVDDLPEHPTPASLRPWIRRYADVTVTSGPLVRVWIEAIEGPLRDARAAVIDWGRRRFASMLRHRPLGDIEVGAELLLAIVEVYGSRPRTKAELDAVVHLIERGFLAPEEPDVPRPGGSDRHGES